MVNIHILVYLLILLTITAGLTAFYSFRLIMFTFLTMPNSTRNNYLNVHEANIIVIISLLTLAIFSIFFGYLSSDLFIGLGSDSFTSSLFIHPNNINMIEAEFSLPLIIKTLPAILSLFGILISFYFYQFNPSYIINITENYYGKIIYGLFNSKYYFDILYNYFIIKTSLNLGLKISNNLEKGLIENIGPYGLSVLLYGTGKIISKLDTGVVTSYALYIVLGLITLIFLVFSPLLFNFYVELEIRLVIIYIITLFLYAIPLYNKFNTSV